MSLDGYVAGPDQSLQEPLGVGGERLHEWAVATRSWRAAHGKKGVRTDGIQAALERAFEAAVGRDVRMKGRK